MLEDSIADPRGPIRPFIIYVLIYYNRSSAPFDPAPRWPSPLPFSSPRRANGGGESAKKVARISERALIRALIDPWIRSSAHSSGVASPSSSKISLDIRNTPLPRLRDIMKATKGFPASHASFIAISRSNWTSYRIKFRDRKSSPCPPWLSRYPPGRKKEELEVSPIRSLASPRKKVIGRAPPVDKGAATWKEERLTRWLTRICTGSLTPRRATQPAIPPN